MKEIHATKICLFIPLQVCIPPIDMDVVGPAVERVRAQEEVEIIQVVDAEYQDMGIWCPGELKSGPSG